MTGKLCSQEALLSLHASLVFITECWRKKKKNSLDERLGHCPVQNMLSGRRRNWWFRLNMKRYVHIFMSGWHFVVSLTGNVPIYFEVFKIKAHMYAGTRNGSNVQMTTSGCTDGEKIWNIYGGSSFEDTGKVFIFFFHLWLHFVFLYK